MKVVPVKVEDGVLKIAGEVVIPPNSQLSILLTNADEESLSLLEANESFLFLKTEPDIYSDDDILKNRRNEKFSS